MKRTLSFLSLLMVCNGSHAFLSDDAFTQPVFKPVVSFPEVKAAGFISMRQEGALHTNDEMVIQTAPVMTVKHEKQDHFQVASAGTPVLNSDSSIVRQEILMPHKPNIQYAGQTAFVGKTNMEQKSLPVADKVEEVAVADVAPLNTKDQFVLPYKKGKTTDTPVVQSKTAEQLAKAPVNLKQEFRKTYVSENKYLTSFEEFPLPKLGLDQGFGDDPDMDLFKGPASAPEAPKAASVAKAPVLPPLPTSDSSDASSDEFADELAAFSEESSTESDHADTQNISVLQMKISFDEDASAVSSTNLDLITSFAQVLQNDPTNGVEIRISDQSMRELSKKKIAARRLAIISQILRDQGLKENQIKPVLSKREFDSVTLRVINLDQHQRLTTTKTDSLGKVIEERSHNIMEW